MAMRMSGLMSGLDTESLIQELVSARRTKVDNAVKAQKKLEWKQEAWKDMNSKIKNLRTKYINNMRFTTSYMKKSTKVSDDSAVSVITGENAVNGVQELTVEKLAKTAYLTGAQIGDGSLTATSTFKDLGLVGQEVADDTKIGSITLNKGEETLTLDITASTSISDVLTWMKDEGGLNANFDAKNGRFFVSAKESGAANNFTMNGTGGVLSALGLSISSGAKKITGQDAEITLNDATFTSTTNVFDINGLTFTALNETKGNVVTVTTQDDVDGIYDMVKDFLKEYNAVINEMDKLYNADSAKGYEPLTDEEKEAMSETEAEKYEKKIKDALLRNDSNLSSVSSALKEVMSAGITVNGKTMFLNSFGIETLGYFEAPDNEKNAYHIAGDADDEATSGKADVLKGMIASEPETVVSFFTQLSKNLYDKMESLSKSQDGYRTYGSFYDDKKMKADYADYTTKIKELEDKLADYEDKWYAKFADMETALAKMQSNTNAVTSLLGGL